jgi:hypothetical protein
LRRLDTIRAWTCAFYLEQDGLEARLFDDVARPDVIEGLAITLAFGR